MIVEKGTVRVGAVRAEAGSRSDSGFQNIDYKKPIFMKLKHL
jgi:hypothetical protein